MRVNSIRAEKLSAIVSRILTKKEAFISGRFLRLCSSSLIVLFDDIHFSPIFLKVKSMKTVQMFCSSNSLKTAWHQVKGQFN